MRQELVKLLDETVPDWRDMPTRELIAMIFTKMKEAEVDKRNPEKPPDNTWSEG